MKNNTPHKTSKSIGRKLMTSCVLATLLFVACHPTLEVTSQKVTSSPSESLVYYLPKTGYKIDIPYVIEKKITYTVTVTTNSKTGKDGKVVNTSKRTVEKKDEKVSGCLIKGEIKLTPITYADPSQKYELKYDEKRHINNTSFQVTYCNEGLPVLQSFNAKKESTAPQVISGSVKLVKAAALFAKEFISPTGPLPKGVGEMEFKRMGASEKVNEKNETFIKDSIVTIEEQHTSSHFINPEEAEKGLIINPIRINDTDKTPSVEVKLSKLSGTESSSTNTQATTLKGIVYRTTGAGVLSVTIKNNGIVASEEVINTLVLVPQFGDLALAPIRIKGGKINTSIEFNTTTGGLVQYKIEKESMLAVTLDSISSGLSGANKAYNENKNKGLQNDIDKLDLENAKLELLLKQKQLKDSLSKD